MYLYLISSYCIFLLNTSNYDNFVAVHHVLFFPVGIACLIFTFFLLHYMASVLHLYLHRRCRTNFRQTCLKKWLIHCICSPPSLLLSFFLPSPLCPVPQNPRQLGGVTCFVGKALHCGTVSLFHPSCPPTRFSKTWH